jgi:hypothetical protein
MQWRIDRIYHWKFQLCCELPRTEAERTCKYSLYKSVIQMKYSYLGNVPLNMFAATCHTSHVAPVPEADGSVHVMVVSVALTVGTGQ